MRALSGITCATINNTNVNGCYQSAGNHESKQEPRTFFCFCFKRNFFLSFEKVLFQKFATSIFSTCIDVDPTEPEDIEYLFDDLSRSYSLFLSLPPPLLSQFLQQLFILDRQSFQLFFQLCTFFNFLSIYLQQPLDFLFYVLGYCWGFKSI